MAFCSDTLSDVSSVVRFLIDEACILSSPPVSKVVDVGSLPFDEFPLSVDDVDFLDLKSEAIVKTHARVSYCVGDEVDAEFDGFYYPATVKSMRLGESGELLYSCHWGSNIESDQCELLSSAIRLRVSNAEAVQLPVLNKRLRRNARTKFITRMDRAKPGMTVTTVDKSEHELQLNDVSLKRFRDVNGRFFSYLKVHSFAEKCSKRASLGAESAGLGEKKKCRKRSAKALVFPSGAILDTEAQMITPPGSAVKATNACAEKPSKVRRTRPPRNTGLPPLCVKITPKMESLASNETEVVHPFLSHTSNGQNVPAVVEAVVAMDEHKNSLHQTIASLQQTIAVDTVEKATAAAKMELMQERHVFEKQRVEYDLHVKTSALQDRIAADKAQLKVKDEHISVLKQKLDAVEQAAKAEKQQHQHDMRQLQERMSLLEVNLKNRHPDNIIYDAADAMIDHYLDPQQPNRTGSPIVPLTAAEAKLCESVLAEKVVSPDNLQVQSLAGDTSTYGERHEDTISAENCRLSTISGAISHVGETHDNDATHLSKSVVSKEVSESPIGDLIAAVPRRVFYTPPGVYYPPSTPSYPASGEHPLPHAGVRSSLQYGRQDVSGGSTVLSGYHDPKSYSALSENASSYPKEQVQYGAYGGKSLSCAVSVQDELMNEEVDEIEHNDAEKEEVEETQNASAEAKDVEHIGDGDKQNDTSSPATGHRVFNDQQPNMIAFAYEKFYKVHFGPGGPAATFDVVQKARRTMPSYPLAYTLNAFELEQVVTGYLSAFTRAVYGFTTLRRVVFLDDTFKSCTVTSTLYQMANKQPSPYREALLHLINDADLMSHPDQALVKRLICAYFARKQNADHTSRKRHSP